MKVAIPLVAISAASPLHDFHKPQNTDEKHIDHHLNAIPQIKQGLIGLTVDYDHLNTGKEEENCRIELEHDNSKAVMELIVDKGDGWHYQAVVSFTSGETRKFEGKGQHDSKKSLVRKVSGLIRIMLGN